MRTFGGSRQGAAGRAGQFEKRVGVCRVGAGGAWGAPARRSRSRGRRRELRRRRRGRVASGATSAARGRYCRRRQRSLLAPKPEGAPPEPAAARGCASRSSYRSALPCSRLPPPSPSSRRRPSTPEVSKWGWEGGGRRPGFLSSSLSPSSVSSPAPHHPRAWLPRAEPFGVTERERGRGGTMLGADGGSRAGLLLFTCPGLPIGGLWPGTLLGSLRFTS